MKTKQEFTDGDLLEAIVCPSAKERTPFLLKHDGRVLCTRVPGELIQEKFEEIAKTKPDYLVKQQRKMIYQLAQEEAAAHRFQNYARKNKLVKGFNITDICAKPCANLGQEHAYLLISKDS